MATVIFHGNLKRFANGPIALEVSSFNELMSGLLTQIQGLRQHLRTGYYKVRIGRRYLNEKQIQTTKIALEEDCIVHFTPVVAGAGKNGGVISAIVGVVLIVAGALTYNPYLTSMGVSLLVGGVMQMLTRPPDMNFKVDEGEKQQSTSFSNIRNLTPQGRPIPLLYGEMMTSLILISQGVETFDEKI